MDWSTIIVAGLALIGTLVGSYLSNNKTTALISYRMEQLEEKVSKHNNLIERMYIVERDLKTAFVKIDEVRHDLNNIKHTKED